MALPSSVTADDASMPSIRRPKRRAGRRLLMIALTTLLLLFSHTMKALLLLFRLFQHLGDLRFLISHCATKGLQHLGDLRILVSVCAKKGLQHLELISFCRTKLLQHLGILRILTSVGAQKVRILTSVGAQKVLQHLGLLRILKSVCAQKVLQRLGDLRILVSVCAKKVDFLQQFRLLRSLKSVCAKKVLRHSGLYHNLVSILQHLELISICRKKVLQHSGLLRILIISVCAQKVLQRLRRLPVPNLISVCEKKVLQHLGLLRIFISVCAQGVLQHKLGNLGFLIPIFAEKVLQQLGVLSFLQSTCAKKVLQHSLRLLIRFLISICPEKAICFLLYYIRPKQKYSDNLLRDVKGVIVEHVDYEQVFQLKLLSRDWKALIDEIIPTLSLKKLPVLTACYFFIKNGIWQLAGFDPNCTLAGNGVGKWRRLPPLTFLPADFNPDVGKQFLICANNGLVCISKSERLIVFNPLTRIWRELPPMLYRRNPVLMHMIVDESTHSYQMVVAGSSSDDPEHVDLSKITELYDSRTQQWTKVGDLPGPVFALNEFQAGVYQNGNILCIGFIDQAVKGILGFNMVKRTWSTYSGLPDSSSILQLVENDGQLYLFSEHIEDFGEFNDHCVDRVEWTTRKDNLSIPFKLVNVFKTRKIGGWSMDVFPEYALLPFSKSQLCVCNTVDRTGEIYDVEDRERFELLQAINSEHHGEVRLCTLNHMSFTLEPRFDTKALTEHIE